MVDEFIYPEDRYLLIGKIVKPHGIRGELKIYSYSEQPENLLQYNSVVVVDSQGVCTEAIRILTCRIQGKFAVVSLETITNRDLAEQMQGKGVLLELNQLPSTKDDEFYWFQLQGLLVETRQGKNLGRVKEIFSNGAQDVMVVADDSQEYMVPILKDIFVAQDKEKIIIDPPPGLLEMNTGDDA